MCFVDEKKDIDFEAEGDRRVLEQMHIFPVPPSYMLYSCRESLTKDCQWKTLFPSSSRSQSELPPTTKTALAQAAAN